jgi:hypothetical protein
MALLILIKNITDKYESPSEILFYRNALNLSLCISILLDIAYYCGNAYPWYYAKNVLPGLANLIPIDCTQKPLNCNVDNYYQAGLSFSYAGYSVQGFSQYGNRKKHRRFHYYIRLTPYNQVISHLQLRVGSLHFLFIPIRLEIQHPYIVRLILAIHLYRSALS